MSSSDRTIKALDTIQRATAIRYKSEQGSQVRWKCRQCGNIRYTWYDRFPPGAPQWERLLVLVCEQPTNQPEGQYTETDPRTKERRTRTAYAVCGTRHVCAVPDDWIAWAERWRPYQRAQDGLSGPTGWDLTPCPPLSDEPPAIYPRRESRDMSTRFAYFILSDKNGGPGRPAADIGALVVSGESYTREVTDRDDLWEGATDEYADLLVLYPHDPRLQQMLLSILPDVKAEAAADAEAGKPWQPERVIEIFEVPKGLDSGCWEWRSHQSIDHDTLSQIVVEAPSPPTDVMPQPRVPVPNPPALYAPPQPAPEPPADAVVVAFDAGEDLPEASPAELLDGVWTEWVDDEDTDPGATVIAEAIPTTAPAGEE